MWLSFRETASLTLLNLLRADSWVLLPVLSWLESLSPSNVECRDAGKLNFRLWCCWVICCKFDEVEGPATGRTSSMADQLCARINTYRILKNEYPEKKEIFCTGTLKIVLFSWRIQDDNQWLLQNIYSLYYTYTGFTEL